MRNFVSHEQVIQVTDTEAPVIDIPDDMIVECDEVLPFEEVTVEDNCTTDPYFEVQVDTARSLPQQLCDSAKVCRGGRLRQRQPSQPIHHHCRHHSASFR